MPESLFIMMYLSKTVFLLENILLLYVFLTPGRTRLFQVLIFAATWTAGNSVRYFLMFIFPDHAMLSYITGFFYLIPCLLIFKETVRAKIFVFFMIYSLTQFTYLVFIHIDRFFVPSVPYTFVLIGMLIELSLIPFIYRHARKPLRSILEIMDMQNPVFTLFPILSFMLLAVYGLEDNYRLTTFITLVLSTLLIFFAYYLTATSISAAKRLHELEQISMTDSLTGLYNRRYMDNKIKQEFQHCLRSGTGFALACADIDFFKKVNDLHGHDSGDLILKDISRIFMESIRAYDTAARWGGEEFLFLFPEANEEQAMQLCERIRKRVEDEISVSGDRAAPLTITIGVAVFNPADSINMTIKKADMALYYGKRGGRNCVIPFSRIAGELPL